MWALLLSVIAAAAGGTGTSVIDTCRDVELAPGIDITPGETILIVGELHGTNEGPRALGDLICRFAQEDMSVALLLEMDEEYSESLARLTGEEDQDRGLICEGLAGFWEQARPRGGDGRSSTAIADLILRAAHIGTEMDATVSVIAMDGWSGDFSGGVNMARRDTMAATAVSAIETHDVVIINVGNRHPIGVHRRIQEAGSALRPLRVQQVYEAGTAWVCLSGGGCGEHEMPRSSRTPEEGVAMELQLEPADADNHDAIFHLGGPITASPPVIRSDFCGDRFADTH